MKILYLFVYVLGLFFNPGTPPLTAERPYYIYTIPSGFSQLANMERNGLLSFADNNGNGMDVYIENKTLEDEILDVKDQYQGQISEEKFINDHTVLYRIESYEEIYRVYTIILCAKTNFTAYAFMFKEADSATYGEFEEKALNLLESLAEGEKDVLQQTGIAGGSSRDSLALGQFGES